MKIDAIILDMDGTLYNLDDVLSQVYQYQIEFLSAKKGWKKEQCVLFFEDNNIYPTMRKNSKSATELFQNLGIDKNEWKEYREIHFDVSRIDKNQAVSNKTLLDLSHIAPLFLLSSNTYKTIKEVLKHLEIDVSFFTDIYCSDFNVSGSFNKKNAMQSICCKYSVSPIRLLSIGDRYNTDIKPVVELGGKGLQVTGPQALQKIMMDIKRECILDCDEYKVF